MIELCKICHDVTSVGSASVPWFPTQVSDLDFLGKRLLSEGDGIQEVDHPGFKDPEYRKRREFISQVALNYKVGEPIPSLVYTPEEKSVWKYIYPRLMEIFETTACKEFMWTINDFQKHINFSEDEIPQLEGIS